MFIIFCTALAGFWSVNKAYLNLNLNLKNVTCFLYVSVYSLNLFPSHFVSFWFLYLDFSAHSFWCANWKKCLKKAEWKQIDAPQRMNRDHGWNKLHQTSEPKVCFSFIKTSSVNNKWMINIYSLGFILFVIEKKLHKLIMWPKVLNGTNIFKMWFFNR